MPWWRLWAWRCSISDLIMTGGNYKKIILVYMVAPLSQWLVFKMVHGLTDRVGTLWAGRLYLMLWSKSYKGESAKWCIDLELNPGHLVQNPKPYVLPIKRQTKTNRHQAAGTRFWILVFHPPNPWSLLTWVVWHMESLCIRYMNFTIDSLRSKLYLDHISTFGFSCDLNNVGQLQ